ncbi:MAG: hypothetical protein NTX95_02520 [Actinobacteria bacterium]|nr:hypothetical protein [Actinomycetota bacterium]
MGFILFILVLGGVYAVAVALGAGFWVATIAAWIVALFCSFIWFNARNSRRY